MWAERRQVYLFATALLWGLLLGRAWQHFRFPPDYTFLLGDYALSRALPLLGAGICLFSALLLSWPGKLPRGVEIFAAGISCLLLMLLSALSFQKNQQYVPQFIEHGTQFLFPVIYLFLRWGAFHRPGEKLILFFKLAVALTFAGHGLFAAGIYPLPGHFVAMTQNILGLPQAASIQFLRVMGILDLVVAVAIFVPQVARPALIYALIWGFLTAFARVVAYFDWADPAGSIDRWLFETLVRLCHGGLPFLIWSFSKASRPAQIVA